MCIELNIDLQDDAFGLVDGMTRLAWHTRMVVEPSNHGGLKWNPPGRNLGSWSKRSIDKKRWFKAREVQ